MSVTDVNPDRIYYVQVNNNSDVDFDDMFDGVPVKISAHSTHNMRAEMANHLFGWTETATPEQMFKYFSKRQGWNTTEHIKRENGKTLAERMFEKFEIRKVAYRMVEDKPDLDKPIPAEPEILPALPKRKGAKDDPFMRELGAQ